MRRERVTIEVEGLLLAGEVHAPPGPGPHPVLVLCHGIPRGGPPEPGDEGYPGLARRFAEHGFYTLIFNFRGCGESQGNFDLRGWVRDLKGALDWVWEQPEIDRRRLSLWGSSAGAAVAVMVAARDQRPTAVVAGACPARFTFLETPEQRQAFIENARRVGMIRDTNFPPSPDWDGGRSEVVPVKWVGRIAPRPLLILHGQQDEVVPPAQARALYQAAREPKELRILPGVGHQLRKEPKAVAASLVWLKQENGLGA